MYMSTSWDNKNSGGIPIFIEGLYFKSMHSISIIIYLKIFGSAFRLSCERMLLRYFEIFRGHLLEVSVTVSEATFSK